MKFVYSSAHLGHDTVYETVLGQVIPANEVAERADRIRTTLLDDGGFEPTGPTDHGETPILAVHDEGFLRFLESAWPEVRRQGLGRPVLIADTFPTWKMFEGMS